MDPKQLKPPTGYFEQLALDLQIEEEPFVPEPGRNYPPSPAEANLRSEAAREQLESGGSAAWLEAYFHLRDAHWPWRVAVYIAWASSPKIGRQPARLEDLATQVLGLTGTRVIHHWRQQNPGIDEVVATLQAAPLMAHRADVFKALAQSASDPDHRSNPDRKLFLEITGDYVPHSKVEVDRGEVGDLSAMSDAELDLLARKLLEQKEDDGQ